MKIFQIVENLCHYDATGTFYPADGEKPKPPTLPTMGNTGGQNGADGICVITYVAQES